MKERNNALNVSMSFYTHNKMLLFIQLLLV